MSALKDLTGQTFGRLTVEYRSVNIGRDVMWSCSCSCGTKPITKGSLLRAGKTRSCGCLRSELVSQKNMRHGMAETPEYNTWCAIKARCGNPDVREWRWYGARGIRVCDRWLNSFENFYADMGPRPVGKTRRRGDGYSIDRIDNSGNYEPGNCRWATMSEQRSNRGQRA